MQDCSPAPTSRPRASRTPSSSTRSPRRSTPPTRTTRSPRPTPGPAPGRTTSSNAPDLDLLAVNSYGAIGGVKQDWIDGGYTKPYIVTEAGPAGEWEVPERRQRRARPSRPTCRSGRLHGELELRSRATRAWRSGATEFHYGLENDFGGVWLNTYHRRLARLGYHALKQAYTGTPAGDNTPPEITSMTVGNARPPSRPAATSRVNAGVTRPERRPDPLQPDVQQQAHQRRHAGSTTCASPQTGNGTFTVTAPEQLGVWKVYVYALRRPGQRRHRDEVVQGGRRRRSPGTNMALGKPRHRVDATSRPARQRPAAAGVRRRTATPAPAGPATGATRSGSRSTWARSPVQPRPAGVGGGLRQGATRSRPPTTAPPGRTVYSDHHRQRRLRRPSTWPAPAATSG